jgi:cysteine desulfurase / selenocysteine lyase
MKNSSGLDVRSQFPQLKRSVHGHPLVYLDNGATTLKPQSVIDRISSYYASEVANIHRGAHFLGDEGTAHFEAVRAQVQKFIGAAAPEEIVFTKGTTDGINLLAQTLCSPLKAGDEILLSEMEHHSNIVPWQMAAETRGVKIKAVRVTEDGEIDRGDFTAKLQGRVKIVSLTHLSNVLGTINPIAELVSLAKAAGAVTVIDAAQTVALGLVDVRRLGCDYLVFSAHKMYGPTGLGVLYGRKELFSLLPPYQGGGSMIDQVTFEKSTYLEIPHRFEAGTPPIAQVIGLGAAIEFLQSLDFAEVKAMEKSLLARLEGALLESRCQIVGRSPSRANILSFNRPGAHASDVGQLLDQQGVAVRTGHHCCQPLMARLGISSTVRVSLAAYNTMDDIDRFLLAYKKANEVLP